MIDQDMDLKDLPWEENLKKLLFQLYHAVGQQVGYFRERSVC